MYPAYVKRGCVNHDVVCESHVTFHVQTIGWHAKPMDYIWNLWISCETHVNTHVNVKPHWRTASLWDDMWNPSKMLSTRLHDCCTKTQRYNLNALIWMELDHIFWVTFLWVFCPMSSGWSAWTPGDVIRVSGWKGFFSVSGTDSVLRCVHSEDKAPLTELFIQLKRQDRPLLFWPFTIRVPDMSAHTAKVLIKGS